MADSDSPTESDVRSDYSDTERQIFDAALEVFARKGRDGARMQEIADAADINKAMLHYYFRNKETLYAEVFEFTMRRFMASFGASMKDAPTFEETLRVFIDGYVEFVRSNEDAMRLMVNENLAGGTLLGQHLKRLKKSSAAPPQILVEKIEQAADAGEIRPVPNGEERLREAAKHGFRRAIVPKSNAPKRAPDGLEVVPVARLAEVIDAL